jgi:hypothetical protein
MRAAIAILMMASAALSGCTPAARPKVEDQTRRVAPLPACVLHLPARRVESAGTLRKLREEQIVKLMFPAFDEDKRALPNGSPACTGRPVLDDPTVAQGTVAKGWPHVVQEGDIVYGSGGDRIRVIWLKVYAWGDGTVGGPIALVRSNERFAELFAIGAYRGRGDRVKLATQRIGGDVFVTAEDDTCEGHRAGVGCETRLSVFLARKGVLGRVVDIPIERLDYLAQGERGAVGKLEYRMTSAADFRQDGIHLVEQIRVKDDVGRELRKAELERLFVLDDITGKMASSEPPLWDRVVTPDRPQTKDERPRN